MWSMFLLLLLQLLCLFAMNSVDINQWIHEYQLVHLKSNVFARFNAVILIISVYCLFCSVFCCCCIGFFLSACICRCWPVCCSKGGYGSMRKVLPIINITNFLQCLAFFVESFLQQIVDFFKLDCHKLDFCLHSPLNWTLRF